MSRHACQTLFARFASIFLFLILALGAVEGGLRLRSSWIRNPTPVGSASRTVLLYGDSISAGLGAELQMELKRLGADVRVIEFAVPNFTTEALLNRITEDLENWKPELVLTMIGRSDRANPYQVLVPGLLSELRILRLADFYSQSIADTFFRKKGWGLLLSRVLRAVTSSDCCELLSDLSTTLGRTFGDHSNPKMAREFLELGVLLSKTPYALASLAKVELADGRIEAALDLYEKRVILHPSCLICVNLVMLSYLQAFEYERGHWFLRELSRISPLRDLALSYARYLSPDRPLYAIPDPDPRLEVQDPVWDDRVPRHIKLARIDDLNSRGEFQRASEEYLHMSSEYSYPFLENTYLHLGRIVAQIRKSGARWVALQYPSDGIETFTQALSMNGIRGVAIETRKFLGDEIKANPLLRLDDLLSLDLDHLTQTGRRTIARGLAPVLMNHFISGENP